VYKYQIDRFSIANLIYIFGIFECIFINVIDYFQICIFLINKAASVINIFYLNLFNLVIFYQFLLIAIFNIIYNNDVVIEHMYPRRISAIKLIIY